jgi:hypothetical protein
MIIKDIIEFALSFVAGAALGHLIDVKIARAVKATEAKLEAGFEAIVKDIKAKV